MILSGRVSIRMKEVNMKEYSVLRCRFGGELKKGYLWKMPLNKFKYKLFCWLVAAKQGRNYCGDVIDQERKRGNY